MRTKGHELLEEFIGRESLTDYGFACLMQDAAGRKDKLLTPQKRPPTGLVRRIRAGSMPQYRTRRLMSEASDGFIGEASWEQPA